MCRTHRNADTKCVGHTEMLTSGVSNTHGENKCVGFRTLASCGVMGACCGGGGCCCGGGGGGRYCFGGAAGWYACGGCAYCGGRRVSVLDTLPCVLDTLDVSTYRRGGGSRAPAEAERTAAGVSRRRAAREAFAPPEGEFAPPEEAFAPPAPA